MIWLSELGPGDFFTFGGPGDHTCVFLGSDAGRLYSHAVHEPDRALIHGLSYVTTIDQPVTLRPDPVDTVEYRQSRWAFVKRALTTWKG